MSLSIGRSRVAHQEASWRNGALADWIISIGDDEFETHRYVLSVGPRSSSYFYHQITFGFGSSLEGRSVLEIGRAMFCTCNADPCACSPLIRHRLSEVDRIAADAFPLVLEYMYEGHCDRLAADSILAVLVVADFLQIDALVSLCEQRFAPLLNDTNACHLLEVIDLCQVRSEKVLEDCIRYIAERFCHLSFEHLPPRYIQKILSHPQCPTNDIVPYVVRVLRRGLSSIDDIILLLSTIENVTSVPDALFILSIPAITSLTNQCIDIIVWNFHELPIGDLTPLSPEVLVRLLERDDLRVASEDQVFAHIASYVQSHAELTSEDTRLIWSSCRFAFASATTLWTANASVNIPNDLVVDGAITARAISQALSTSAVPRNWFKPELALFGEIPDRRGLLLHGASGVQHGLNKQYATYHTREAVDSRYMGHPMCWRFHIKGNVQGMSIGLAAKAKASARLGSRAMQSWALQCSTGKKLHNGVASPYQLEWQDGDQIDMVLGIDGSLRFHKNGTRFGVAFDGIRERVRPAVTMYRRQQQVLIELIMPQPV